VSEPQTALAARVGAEPGAGSGPHAFVADLERPELDDGDRHHLARVLRTRAGDPLTVSDGAGRWRPCRFGDTLEATGPVVSVPAPAPAITVAFALVKGERPEWVTQKLTELGVDVVVPFTADRSVVRWEPDRAATALERLRRVAREAAMQCRRCWLPELSAPVDFSAAATLPGAALADRAGSPPTLDHPTVLVGPEGGWSPRERSTDLPMVTLGAHGLRAETAAITAGALLSALRGGIVAPSPPMSGGEPDSRSGTLGG
jgi:16S rRNA (uracil1498-N3)-methyltransferase